MNQMTKHLAQSLWDCATHVMEKKLISCSQYEPQRCIHITETEVTAKGLSVASLHFR